MESALQQFIEEMGLYFESEGSPRIAGRLYAFLLLQEEPRSLDDLTAGLQVSKASVSSNARLLEHHGLVQRVATPGDRRDFYVATPDPTRSIELRLAGVRRFARLLEEVTPAVPARTSAVRDRLEGMLSVTDEIVRLLSDVLSRRRGG